MIIVNWIFIKTRIHEKYAFRVNKLTKAILIWYFIYFGFSSICIFFIRILFDNYFVCVGPVGCHADCKTCGSEGGNPNDDCLTCASDLKELNVKGQDGTGVCELKYFNAAIDNCKKYFLANNKCAVCAAGFTLTSDKSKCFAPITNCAAHNGDGKCTQCTSPFVLKNGGSSCGVGILEMLVISGAIGCIALLRDIFVSIFMCSGYTCADRAQCVFFDLLSWCASAKSAYRSKAFRFVDSCDVQCWTDGDILICVWFMCKNNDSCIGTPRPTQFILCDLIRR